MVRKRCIYGPCGSYEHPKTKQNGFTGLKFIKFPSPKTEREKCQRWVEACGRKDFTISNVKSSTYICSKHFINNNGPTDECPDPVPLIKVLNPELHPFYFAEVSSQETPSREIPTDKQILNPETKTPRIEKRKDTKHSQLRLQKVDENNTNSLNFSSLSPPIGWCMELKSNGVIFSRIKNSLVVLQCIFSYDEKLDVKIIVLGVEIAVEKLFKHIELKNNGDIYKFLLKVNEYKVCPGNDDEDMVSIYKSLAKNNNRKTKSHYSEQFGSVYSNDCHRLIQKKKKKCQACIVHRRSLRVLRLRHRAKALTKTAEGKVLLEKHSSYKSKQRSRNKAVVVNMKANKMASATLQFCADKLVTPKTGAPSRKGTEQRFSSSKERKTKNEISILKQLFKARLQNEKSGSFMSIFLKQQIGALERPKFGMKWDRNFIKWCLYIKNKSQSTYQALRKSGTIILPSLRTLYNHCRTGNNESGFGQEVFDEMIEETKNINNLPEKDKYLSPSANLNTFQD